MTREEFEQYAAENGLIIWDKEMSEKVLQAASKPDQIECGIAGNTYRLVINNEQKSCEDCISRKYLLSIANEDGAYGYVSAYDIINAPSISKTEWIPIKDNMPNVGEEVLICNSDGDIYLTYFHGWGFVGSNVVAWRPLPTPYKDRK